MDDRLPPLTRHAGSHAANVREQWYKSGERTGHVVRTFQWRCARKQKVPATHEAIRPISLVEIQEARQRIATTILRTPLIRLQMRSDYPEVRLKLETLQPTNSFKLRGAANAVAMLSDAERKRGIWTISAGNAGQGVAYAAKQAGIPCTVVVFETAPVSKIERMKALGARLVPVPYEVAWQALEERSFPGVEGILVHPFDDHNFIAGHATMGLEILEDAPDTAAIIAGIGGGGLVVGIGSAVKALKPEIFSARNRKRPLRPRFHSRSDRRRCSRSENHRSWTALAA